MSLVVLLFNLTFVKADKASLLLVQESHVNPALRLKDEVQRDIQTERANAAVTVFPNQLPVYEDQSHENDKLQWQYFDERAYVDKTKLQPGQDAYARNKFNQAASDQLMSNREIPDSRHPL